MDTQSYPTKGSLENSSISQLPGDATTTTGSRSSSTTFGGIGDIIPPPTSWFEPHDNLTEKISHLEKLTDMNHQERAIITTPAVATTTDATTEATKLIRIRTSCERRQLLSTHNSIDHASTASTPEQHSLLHLPTQQYIKDDYEEPSLEAAKAVIGNPRPSPSWKEISSQVLPAAARELLSSSLRKIYYTARLSYSLGRWQRKYSDMGSVSGGTYAHKTNQNLSLPDYLPELPPFSTLPWIDRQLVREWRTYLPENPRKITASTSKGDHNHYDDDDEDDHSLDLDDFERARTLVPNTLPRPTWQKSDVCFDCHQSFGPTRLRHHCRSCGRSFCHAHSCSTHRLPYLGYQDLPERVCDRCKQMLEEQNLAERVAWRLARCRDFSNHNLTPYFETGLDSVEEVAIRVTKMAIAMAKRIPLGAQATVAVETVDVLRKYGLHGIYGIMLRKEFLAAADLLRKALGINKTSWPLSVHELSAAIFYALAQHRAMRGLNPEREHIIHQFRPQHGLMVQEGPSSLPIWTQTRETTLVSVQGLTRSAPSVAVDSYELAALDFHSTPVIDPTDIYKPDFSSSASTIEDETHAADVSQDPRPTLVPTGTEKTTTSKTTTCVPVCDPVSDALLASLVFYAPIALNFIYAEKEVEMQLLAAQQGWRLLYAFLTQDLENTNPADRPATALFIHQEKRIVCLSIRGTTTINDVITDIRQTPVPFPDLDPDCKYDNNDGDWTSVFHGQGLALCGMAAAAVNIFREHVDSILYFAKKGYRIRLVGHSLGGGVATLMGILVLKHLERFPELNQKMESTSEESARLRVYAYGTPSCLNGSLAASVDSFVTTVVLHDDVFPRLTPTSCRGLLKHLLHIRETWVKTHIEEDLRAVGERAKTAWAPRFRQSFALHSTSTSSIKKYCKKQIQKGRITLKSVRDKAIGRPPTERMTKNVRDSLADHQDGVDAVVEVVSISSSPSEWGEKFFVPATEVSISESFDSSREEKAVSDEEYADQPQLLLEMLGCGDTETEGLVIDGDEFFEPEESLLEGSDEESEWLDKDMIRDPIPVAPPDESVERADSWTLEMQGGVPSPTNGLLSSDVKDVNGPAAVVVEEVPLPRMFIPGKVIHIYSHRGVYKAAFVPRSFRELRRISLAGNMLSNHTTKSYYEGLLEVQTARVAPEAPPRWTAFDEDDTCSCCANRFTWASTSSSEAQEARDKHNCRSCGGLVCDPCAKNRVPIPAIGLTTPVRTCDRCYNDIMGGVSASSSVLTSSFLGVEDNSALSDSFPATSIRRSGNIKNHDERPERQRPKRSVIVDDLVSQMRSSALTQH
jgi:hypothetical protein